LTERGTELARPMMAAARRMLAEKRMLIYCQVTEG
jgi:hypothetical protein